MCLATHFITHMRSSSRASGGGGITCPANFEYDGVVGFGRLCESVTEQVLGVGLSTVVVEYL